MSDKNKGSIIIDAMNNLGTAENVQKYVLGTKKSGQPRALYDILRDFLPSTKKKKKKKSDNSFSVFLQNKKGKKKKNKKNKYWHI